METVFYCSFTAHVEPAQYYPEKGPLYYLMQGYDNRRIMTVDNIGPAGVINNKKSYHFSRDVQNFFKPDLFKFNAFM